MPYYPPSSPPGGSDTQVQFNDGGSFGGSSNLIYDKSSDKRLQISDGILNIANSGADGSLKEIIRSQLDGYTGTGNWRNSIYSSVSGSAASSILKFSLANSQTTQADIMTLLGNGYVGIGKTPIAALDVAGGIVASETIISSTGLWVSSTNAAQCAFHFASNTNFLYPYQSYNRYRGTLSALEAVQAGDYIGSTNFYGQTGAGLAGVAAFAALVESVTGNYLSGQLLFNVGDGTSAGANFNAFSVSSTKTVFNTLLNGFGQSSPTAVLHLKAGTATANTAPLKFTSGTKLTTTEAGVHEYNGNHLLTNANIRFPVGGVLFDHYSDVGNVGTGEDDLYSDTLAASTLANNGDKVTATFQGVFVGAAASTQELRIYFGGTKIYDSGALAIGAATNAWTAQVTIIRESSSVVRCSVAISTDFATLFPYSSYTRITGLTLTNTQILKLTGEAAGVGAANDQIIAKMGYVEFKPTS